MRRYCTKQKQLVQMLENEAEMDMDFGGGEVWNTVVSSVVAVTAAVEEDVEENLEEEVGVDFTESDKLANELGQLETTDEEDSSDDGDSLMTPLHLSVDSDKEDNSPMFGCSSKSSKRKKPQDKQRSSKRISR